MLLQGLSEKQIAREQGLSPHTVHAYIKSLHKRFGAQSRGELLAICYGCSSRTHGGRRSHVAGRIEIRPVVELPEMLPIRAPFAAPVMREVGRGVFGRIVTPANVEFSPGC